MLLKDKKGQFCSRKVWFSENKQRCVYPTINKNFLKCENALEEFYAFPLPLIVTALQNAQKIAVIQSGGTRGIYINENGAVAIDGLLGYTCGGQTSEICINQITAKLAIDIAEQEEAVKFALGC